CPSTSVTCSYNDPPTVAVFPLSLHDALPIYTRGNALTFQKVAGLECDFHFRAGCEDRHLGIVACGSKLIGAESRQVLVAMLGAEDRKSTRLNSSHVKISYAVFCLKKKIKSTL